MDTEILAAEAQLPTKYNRSQLKISRKNRRLLCHVMGNIYVLMIRAVFEQGGTPWKNGVQKNYTSCVDKYYDETPANALVTVPSKSQEH